MESNVRIELGFDGQMNFKISVTENATDEEMQRARQKCEDMAQYLSEKYNLLDAMFPVRQGV